MIQPARSRNPRRQARSGRVRARVARRSAFPQHDGQRRAAARAARLPGPATIPAGEVTATARNRCRERCDIATSRQVDVPPGAGVSLSRVAARRGGHAALAVVNRRRRRQNAAKRGDKSGGGARGGGDTAPRVSDVTARCGAPRDALRELSAPISCRGPSSTLPGWGLRRIGFEKRYGTWSRCSRFCVSALADLTDMVSLARSPAAACIRVICSSLF